MCGSNTTFIGVFYIEPALSVREFEDSIAIDSSSSSDEECEYDQSDSPAPPKRFPAQVWKEKCPPAQIDPLVTQKLHEKVGSLH